MEKEYLLLKQMFFKFCETKYMRSNLGDKIIDFETIPVKFHVEPHENNFAFYLRNCILLYDEYTIGVHKGINYALRSSSIEIGSSIKIDKSCERICALSGHKHIHKRKSYQQGFHRNIVYSRLKRSNLLVKESSFIVEKS